MSRNQQFFAAAFSLAFVAGAARAQSEAASLGELAQLPIATIAPAVLPASGGEFLVRASECSGYAVVYALERLCDGMAVQVEVAGRGARPSGLARGSVVSAKPFSTGIVLLSGSEAIAFVPNALGRALLGA
jgi:hypothetical protein